MDRLTADPNAHVAWRDLVPMTFLEKVWELCLSIPWLVASVILYARGQIFLGAVCSFYFFLTGLRQSHGAQHYSLGIPRGWQDRLMFALSVLMLASMHAVQASHLHHHRRCLEEDDAEGMTARWPWWLAIVSGPIFLWRLHRFAWKTAKPKGRWWIQMELSAMLCMVAMVTLVPGLSWLRWHVAAMVVGECLTGFFAVWTVHHDCDDSGFPARTQRGVLSNFLFYNMFYHEEHHRYPQVPTCHLGELASRLDKVAGRPVKQVLGWSGYKKRRFPASKEASTAPESC